MRLLPCRQLSRYLKRASVSEPLSPVMQAHLDGCHSCRDAWGQRAGIHTLLTQSRDSVVEIPPGAQAVFEVKRALANQERRAKPFPSSLERRWVGAVALGGLVLAGGYGASMWFSPSRTNHPAVMAKRTPSGVVSPSLAPRHSRTPLPAVPRQDDDLAYLNPPADETPPSTLALRIERWVRHGGERNDSPRLSTLVSPTESSNATPNRKHDSGVSLEKSGGNDPRLLQKIDLDYPEVGVTRLAAILEARTGISYRVAPELNDLKLAVFAKDQPVRDFMRQIAGLFQLEWDRTQENGRYQYLLRPRFTPGGPPDALSPLHTRKVIRDKSYAVEQLVPRNSSR